MYWWAILVPPGTVCIQCTSEGAVATDAVFQIDNTAIDEHRESNGWYSGCI